MKAFRKNEDSLFSHLPLPHQKKEYENIVS